MRLFRTAVKKRLEELTQLKLGWDGYRGRPVASPNAHFALSMLESIFGQETTSGVDEGASINTPQLVPGPNGDLQVEWHTLKGDIEIHVKAPNVVSAWRLMVNRPQVLNGDPDVVNRPQGEVIDLTDDFSIVKKWVKEMTE